ncbi:MAG: aconitate hydratase [Planctomycetota bacterium]|nr:aconitate hydratase [Planctomycetota bacterium]
MKENLTKKIIREHIVEGEMIPGTEIALKIDQTLVQDATGTMVWQQFRTFGIPKVKNDISITFIDHNMIQTGFENPDDHLFLQSMASRYGAIFSRPGNGISHFAYLERYDLPGATMLGSDSHTCHAGALCVLAMGAGGAEVAAAMAGIPFYVRMPKVVKVHLTNELPAWVSAKDVILEILRRMSVKGGVGKVLEYSGPGIETLSVYERSTLANMGQETGATSTLFPSDGIAKRFLEAQGRKEDWKEILPDPDAEYDEVLEIDLSKVEPLIAKPHSPGNVVPVREVAGLPVRQVAVGSSVNSSYRDLMMVARILKGKHVAPNLHMTMSPGSRQILLNLLREGVLMDMTLAGVRALEVACGPCIGMGAAPPSGGISLRTFNRNFRGRSGTAADQVYLCSPETATATAISGVITDPRDLGEPIEIIEPERYMTYTADFLPPSEDPESVEIVEGPNIKPLPDVPPLEQVIEAEVVIALGDNVSTDDILPGGNKVLPLRSNIPAIAEYTFVYVDEGFVSRMKEKKKGILVGGENWGQGSSREHAVIAPMYLGVRAVVARSFARIHLANLVNYDVLPLAFDNPDDLDGIELGHRLRIEGIRDALGSGSQITVKNLTTSQSYSTRAPLTQRQIDILLMGGLSRWVRDQLG